jgi:hypothetical protein
MAILVQWGAKRYLRIRAHLDCKVVSQRQTKSIPGIVLGSHSHAVTDAVLQTSTELGCSVGQ